MSFRVCASSARVPREMPFSSSTVAATTRFPRSGSKLRLSNPAAKTRAANPPLQSAAPRPCRRPFSIEHAAVLSHDGRLTPELFPTGIVHPSASTLTATRSLQAVGLDPIHEVLRQTSGNRRRAAAVLGISTTTLWRMLKRAPK
jgi:transcriptional regulator with GAF, ATPase, and Fis domain